MKLFFIQEKRGFTIVETLVAVTILMIAIAGPLTIAHNGLLAAVTARDRLVASFLAQDGMEYIKSVRDENIASNASNWLKDIADNPLESCNTVSDECTVDTLYNRFSTGNSEIFVSSDGRYTHEASGNKSSGFKRYYTFESFGPDNGRVTMYVDWSNGVLDNQSIVTTSIYRINR